LRFFLDEDVDVSVCTILQALGHDCWTTEQARRLGALDDDQSVYADDKEAVFITHDVEATARRKHHTFGCHVRLACSEPDGRALLVRWLEHLEEMLTRHRPVVVELRWQSLKMFRQWDGGFAGHIPKGIRILRDGSVEELT
jgi:hypothetical protein